VCGPFGRLSRVRGRLGRLRGRPLAATGATVLSALAAVEVRGRSLLPSPAPLPSGEPVGESGYPFPWRSVLIRALLLLVAAAVTLVVVFATG